MPSYYSRVTGDLEAGRLAKSEDINLIQSHVSTGIANMIVDLFGSAFILGHDEDALTLEPTPLLVDQKNTENKDENSAWASIHHIYYRQKFRTTKSEIHSIKIDLINNTEFPVTVQAEIRDIDFNIIAEANYNLKPQLNTTSEFVTAEFVFNQQHLPIGEYYFVIRPIDLSKIDFDKYVQSGQTLEVQEIDPINSFRVRIDQKGQYAHALQASEDGDQWLNASQLPSAVSSWDPEDMAVIPPNYDLYFEQVFSEGNTYIIHNPTTAIINGEKVYPLLQGNLRPTVEVVHLENIVFGVQLIDLADAKLLTLERRQAQHVAIMDAAKLCLAVIHEVLPLSEIEIDDVNRIDLLHIVIVGAAVNVLRDQLGRAEEYALEVGIF